MKKSALIKDIFRDIQKSLGRFISIVGIVALGVAFFSGLKIAPEDMRYTADKYYDDYNLMDIRLVSNLGLTDEDLRAIEKIDGIESALGTYALDAITESGDREIVVKVHSYIDERQINGAKLVEGRFPENINECVIESGKEGLLDIPIGSSLKLSSGKKDPLSNELENLEFEVVGKVTSPYYLSFEKGNTSIGGGQIRDFIMIPQDNFKLEVYTDIYATVEGARELNSYRDEYFDLIDGPIQQIKKISKDREIIRYEEVLGDILEELDKGKSEYFEEKEKAEIELGKALKEIDDGREDLRKATAELKRNEEDFYKRINEGKKKISQGEKELADGEAKLNQALEEFYIEKELAEKRFKDADKELKEAENTISYLEAEIVKIKTSLENPLLSEVDRVKLVASLEETKITLDLVKEKVKIGKSELEAGRKQIADGEAELQRQGEGLSKGRLDLEKEKDNLLKGEKQGLKEFEKAREKLDRARADLEKGESDYEEARLEVEKELAKGWKDIEDGEKELKKIEKTSWYVLDRNSHYSYVDYGGAADRIDSLAKVFPVFFALVAALVSLTTMTRMVDEQRINIGTLKALGYGGGAIASKYILYALTATLIGCILGIGIGYTVFPTIIFNAYGMMYVLPPVILRFNKVLAVGISLVSVGLTTATAFLATNNELKENPASLMRPKAPRLGKRILIERIPFIWNRFNFSYKVTIRNIFRYKRRFFMTVFGIAGCTALILTAFGVRDSIRTIVDRQYGVLFTYDLAIAMDSAGEENIINNDKLEDYILIHKEGVSLSSGKDEIDLSMIVAEDLSKMDKFIRLQNRKTKGRLTIPRNGVIISEQVGKILDVKVGDEILLKNMDKEEATVRVSAITENYTFNYVYLSPSYYDDLFGSKIEFDEALAIIKDEWKESEDQLSRELIEKEGISSVSLNSRLKENFVDTINSLNYVVLVMIISAGALAFVVLYNLTNVNISERIREIATIKVLGFYDNEVSEYIYRENTILTIIGIMAGLIMGIFLHRYIMITVEMENIMFGLTLDYRSYIYSVLLTLTFAVLVNLAMHYRLKNVEMVESLKSVD